MGSVSGMKCTVGVQIFLFCAGGGGGGKNMGDRSISCGASL